MSIKILSLPGVPAVALDELSNTFEIITLKSANNISEQVEKYSNEIRAIVCGVKGPVDETLLVSLPNLEIVFCFGAGLDGIDTEAAARHNVRVLNTSPALADSVADLAMTLLLALARGLIVADKHVRESKWPTSKPPFGMLLAGKRAGILGLGTIGERVARRAQAFGVEIGYHNRSSKSESEFQYFDDFGAMVDWCDFLIVCASGGPTSNKLVNAQILSRIGSHGFLINVSRGSIVDEEALADALDSGVIAGAGLDVFEDEPNVPKRLIQNPRTVLSPHMGSSTNETLTARAKYLHRHLSEHFSILVDESHS